MARCPQCGYAQEWLKIIYLNDYNVVECTSCGAQLQHNKKRTLVIIGVFFVIFFLPLTPFVDIEIGYLWMLTIAVPFCIAWVTLIKLEIAKKFDVTITENQKHDFEVYANKRRQLYRKLALITVLLMSIWFVDAFILNSELNEYIIIFCMLAIFGALFTLFITRCPYCNKITPNMPKCGSCKRDITIHK